MERETRTKSRTYGAYVLTKSFTNNMFNSWEDSPVPSLELVLPTNVGVVVLVVGVGGEVVEVVVELVSCACV